MVVKVRTACCSWQTEMLWHSVQWWIIYEVSTNKQAVIGKQLHKHYHCPAERSPATISVPLSHKFTYYPFVKHTHTQGWKGYFSKCNCLQITECFLMTVVILTLWWLCDSCGCSYIRMTLVTKLWNLRLSGAWFHFNSSITIIYKNDDPFFIY